MSTALRSPAAYIDDAPVGCYLRVQDLPGSPEAARAAAHRAVRRDELVRVRRGLYFKGKKTGYGMTRPPAEDVALETLGRRGVGPSGVSAARMFGLTTQVPVVPELASASPVPTGLAGVLVHKRNNMARRDLNYCEIALLELLRDWEQTAEVSWAHVAAAVEAKIESGAIDSTKVLQAVESERSPAVAIAARRLLVGAPISARP